MVVFGESRSFGFLDCEFCWVSNQERKGSECEAECVESQVLFFKFLRRIISCYFHLIHCSSISAQLCSAGYRNPANHISFFVC